MPYSVITAQQACSTEMVRVAGNAVLSDHSQQACSTEMLKVAGDAVLSDHSRPVVLKWLKSLGMPSTIV